MDGIPLMDDGGAILEIKVPRSIPCWLVEILTKGKIYETSFSKVGVAHILNFKTKNSVPSPLLENCEIENTKGELQYGFTI